MDVFISLPQITYEKVGLFGQVPFEAATKWRNLLSYRFPVCIVFLRFITI